MIRPVTRHSYLGRSRKEPNGHGHRALGRKKRKKKLKQAEDIGDKKMDEEEFATLMIAALSSTYDIFVVSFLSSQRDTMSLPILRSRLLDEAVHQGHSDEHP